MEISSTFWIPDKTNWWHQQNETQSKYANLSNMAHDIFSIIPHGVGVEASDSIWQDVIGWRESKITGETLCENIIVRLFVAINNRILPGDNPVSDTTNTENDSDMQQEAEERKSHWMGKVHDFLERWQGSPKSTCYPERISRSKQEDNYGRIHFGHGIDCQSILVTVSTWWCSCCLIVGKIIYATSFVCKEPPWRTNSNIKCLPKFRESNVIHSKVIRIAHLNAFCTLKIWQSKVSTWNIQMPAKTIAQQPMNLIWRKTMALRVRNVQGCMMWVLHQMFLDWFC